MTERPLRKSIPGLVFTLIFSAHEHSTMAPAKPPGNWTVKKRMEAHDFKLGVDSPNFVAPKVPSSHLPLRLQNGPAAKF